jgi:iron-sulfur cluster repair protein YtfE (RIC family)
MDAFSLLKADHRKVAGLFTQLESARGKAKLQVFEQIKTELELHTHIEEKIFYPALEKPEETHDLTLEAYEEHDVVKKLLNKLSRDKSADEEWEAQTKVLQENVEHHVEEEENELFPKAEEALGDEEIERLGERLEEEKTRKQGHSASKGSSGKKSAASKKTASKTKSGSKAAKKTSKKSASKSKRSSKSSSSKTKKRSRSKKSSKKRR